MSSLVYEIFFILCFFSFIHSQVGYYIYQNHNPFSFVPLTNYPHHVPLPMPLPTSSVSQQQPGILNHHELTVKHLAPAVAHHHQGSSKESCYVPQTPPSWSKPENSGQSAKVNNPKLDYGKCPELEPKKEDKKMEEEKMKECFKDLDLNENSTLEEVTSSQKTMISQCLLRKQELLNDAGKYQYDKAMEKLKGKKLPEDKQKKLEEAHIECKLEAESKFFDSVEILAPIQLYNKCMDFHIKMLCDIKEHVPKKPEKPRFFRDNQNGNDDLNILARSIGSAQ